MVSALVLPKLTSHPGGVINTARSWTHLVDLELADPDFRNRDVIELLLGADAYASVVLPDLRRGEPF